MLKTFSKFLDVGELQVFTGASLCKSSHSSMEGCHQEHICSDFKITTVKPDSMGSVVCGSNQQKMLKRKMDKSCCKR